jgi:hypothetical protein
MQLCSRQICDKKAQSKQYRKDWLLRKGKGSKESTHAHTIIYINKLDGDDLIDATRLLKRQKRQLEAIKRLHEACGHRSVKRLINLRRLCPIKESNLPSHFLKEFKAVQVLSSLSHTSGQGKAVHCVHVYAYDTRPLYPETEYNIRIGGLRAFGRQGTTDCKSVLYQANHRGAV